MKKLLCMLLCLCLTAALCGCVTQNDQGQDIGTGNQPQQTTAPDKTEPSGETTAPEVSNDIQTIEILTKDIYIDCDVSYGVVSEACATLLYTSNDSMIAFCQYTYKAYSGDLDGVFDLFKIKLPNNASTHSRGDLWGCEIEMLSSEKVTVNGFEGIRFTGKVPNKKGWDCHVYGYLFLINNVPCGVVGLVSAEAQDSAMIQQTDAEVETIVSTIRTTK